MRERSVCWCVGYQPSGRRSLDYLHIRPPTQNNNEQLSVGCSLRPALCRLDDYGSWHWRFGANVHLTSPPRSEIDSAIAAIPSTSRIFDISLPLSSCKDFHYYAATGWREESDESAWKKENKKVSLCSLWRNISLRSCWRNAGSCRQRHAELLVDIKSVCGQQFNKGTFESVETFTVREHLKMQETWIYNINIYHCYITLRHVALNLKYIYSDWRPAVPVCLSTNSYFYKTFFFLLFI